MIWRLEKVFKWLQSKIELRSSWPLEGFKFENRITLFFNNIIKTFWVTKLNLGESYNFCKAISVNILPSLSICCKFSNFYFFFRKKIQIQVQKNKIFALVTSLLVPGKNAILTTPCIQGVTPESIVLDILRTIKWFFENIDFICWVGALTSKIFPHST